MAHHRGEDRERAVAIAVGLGVLLEPEDDIGTCELVAEEGLSERRYEGCRCCGDRDGQERLGRRPSLLQTLLFEAAQRPLDQAAIDPPSHDPGGR
jgi:hypothetical protein